MNNVYYFDKSIWLGVWSVNLASLEKNESISFVMVIADVSNKLLFIVVPHESRMKLYLVFAPTER